MGPVRTFSFGVGLSPWPEDYRICDVPWQGRGRRMDEMIAIIRDLLGGGFVGFQGECFQLERIKMERAVCGPEGKGTCTFIQNGATPVYDLGKPGR